MLQYHHVLTESTVQSIEEKRNFPPIQTTSLNMDSHSGDYMSLEKPFEFHQQCWGCESSSMLGLFIVLSRAN